LVTKVADYAFGSNPPYEVVTALMALAEGE
jgi:hypothetical protein